MYQIRILKAVRKDLRKLSKQSATKIVNLCFPQLSKNPHLGIPLSENLKGYWKYVFRFQGVSYRIIYQIFKKERIILIIAVGPREKFYERLLKRIR